MSKSALDNYVELRQYENDGIAEIILFILNLQRFSLAYTVREKGRQFQNKQILVVLILSLL